MKKLLTFAAAAVVLMALGGPSAFADQRSPERTWRDNDRVSVEGRITRVFRDREGFRVELDRGRQSFWVPEERVRGRELRVGVVVRIGGFFRDGIVVADDIGYPDAYGYRDEYRDDHRDYRDRELRGIIERVDYRLRYLIVRERDGDVVKVDMRPVSRYHREPDVDDLHRGDAIVVSGDWRDGLFRAERVDRVRRAW